MQAVSTFTRFTGVVATALMLSFASTASAQQPAAQNPAPEVPAITKEQLLDFMETDHVLGDRDAKVKVIEYASLTCPHCMAYHLETFPELKAKYIDTGKVAFTFRHFPFNPPAVRGAMLAECAADEQFYNYINVMMKTQDKWAFDSNYMGALRNIAKIGGMGEDTFDACMENKDIHDKVVIGMAWAANELGVNSTPTTFVNGEKLAGFHSIEQLASHIDPLLGEKAQKTAE